MALAYLVEVATRALSKQNAAKEQRRRRDNGREKGRRGLLTPLRPEIRAVGLVGTAESN